MTAIFAYIDPASGGAIAAIAAGGIAGIRVAASAMWRGRRGDRSKSADPTSDQASTDSRVDQ